MRVLVVNGPNLNLLGTREPDVYGSDTLADLDGTVAEWGVSMGVDVETVQSNHEGEIIDILHGWHGDGIIINPGALAHTSRALADAIRSVPIPVVEVHISNIREREPWREESVTAEACVRSVYGRGVVGYRDAIRHLVNRAAVPFETVRYGPHDENVGDLRLGDHRLVVLVHGGFWRHEWERDTTESIAVDLTQRGFTTWNIEYRRLGLDGGWPGSAHDVLMALDFVPQLPLQVEGLSVVGHSAGAHLAIWAAPRSHTQVNRMVAMAPITALAMHADSGMYGAGEARALLDAGAPMDVDPGDVPTLLVHGTHDQHVPIAHSTVLAERNGLEVLTTDGGHFELLDPGSPHWDAVIKALDDAV